MHFNRKQTIEKNKYCVLRNFNSNIACKGPSGNWEKNIFHFKNIQSFIVSVEIIFRNFLINIFLTLLPEKNVWAMRQLAAICIIFSLPNTYFNFRIILLTFRYTHTHARASDYFVIFHWLLKYNYVLVKNMS